MIVIQVIVSGWTNGEGCNYGYTRSESILDGGRKMTEEKKFIDIFFDHITLQLKTIDFLKKMGLFDEFLNTLTHEELSLIQATLMIRPEIEKT